MSLIKKISRIFSFLIILSYLASCEEGCFTADQFDSYSEVVDSNPTNDGIQEVSVTRDYANWHETGLRSSGDEFIIRITGEWTPWNGNTMTNSSLNALPLCNLCARKNDDTSSNCICLKEQSPLSYPGKICETFATKGDYVSENDPTSCTCTTDPEEGYDVNPEFSLAYAENIKYSTLNFYEKNGTVKIADAQSRCKYTQGAGLYIGLFGPTGKTVPSRVYHLYSPTEVCNTIITDEEVGCVDSDGNDRTSYEFRSSNSRIFMKDDNAGNIGTDTYAEDDIYHTPNEVVKFKIYDEEYSNNYGQYNLQILRGVGDSSDRSQVGLIEYMVRLVENSILGDINNNDERVGGVIEFMYKAIVQDSGFMGFLRMSLILYVSIYGMAILSGVAEISKKEIMSRVLKVGLVLLFTSNNSWQLYNDIVVGFFLDGMDSVISMINSLSIQALDTSSAAAILDAQLDRASNVSSSTRFTYIDNTIIMLMSEAVSAKIFGLVLADPFGILYIFIIYALIAIFIAIMSYAATVYMINVLKIVFALSLGPLFIVFVLFGQTSQMFKNWISFLAGRSMEIVIMFLVLLNFVVIINITFIEMLSYTTCMESLNLFLFKIYYLKSYVNRPIMEWMVYFMKILGLSFMTYLVLEKVGEIAGQLISVSGAGNQNAAGDARGGSGFALASKFVSGAAGAAGAVAGKAALASAYAGLAVGKGGSVVARESGISGKMSGLAKSIGRATGLSQLTKAISQRAPMELKSPRAFIRDRKYKGMIKDAQKFVKNDPSTKGLTGADKDAAVRARARAIFENSKFSDKYENSKIGKGEMHTANMLGMTDDTFQAALHKHLVEKPLLKAIKQKAKELQSPGAKGGAKFGHEMKDELHKFTNKWADENVSGGSKVVKPFLESKDNFERSKFEFRLNKRIEESTFLSGKKAAKAFYNLPEKAKEYQSHLQDRKNEQMTKTAILDEQRENSKYFSRLAPMRKKAGAAARAIKGISTERYRPDLAAKNFARNVENQKVQNEAGISGYLGNKMNLTNRNNATSAVAAAANRTAKSGAESASRAASQIKDAALKRIRKEDSKKEESGKKEESKNTFARTDRKTGLEIAKKEARSTLRNKLSSSSKDNLSKTFKEKFFSGRNVDKTFEKDKKTGKYVDDGGKKHKSGLDGMAVEDKHKDRQDLAKEAKAERANMLNREVMQKQLSREGKSSLKSQFESLSGSARNKMEEGKELMRSKLAKQDPTKVTDKSAKFETKQDLAKLTSLVGEKGDSFKDIIKGEQDNIKADSAFEQAARLQYLNEKFNLGDKNYEKDLMEKFNARINQDITKAEELLSQAKEDMKKGGSVDKYNEQVKELQNIERAKASAFSDFADEKAKDGKYKEFFEEEIEKATKNIQGRLNNDHGTAFGDGSKIEKSGKDETAETDKSVDSVKKGRLGDESVERMSYLNDQEVTTKLEKLLEENKEKKSEGTTDPEKPTSTGEVEIEEEKKKNEGTTKPEKLGSKEVEIEEEKEKTEEEKENEKEQEERAALQREEIAEQRRKAEEDAEEKEKRKKNDEEKEKEDEEDEKARRDREERDKEADNTRFATPETKQALEKQAQQFKDRLKEFEGKILKIQSKIDQLRAEDPNHPDIRALEIEMQSINSESASMQNEMDKLNESLNTNDENDKNVTKD